MLGKIVVVQHLGQEDKIRKAEVDGKGNDSGEKSSPNRAGKVGYISEEPG